MLVVDQHALQTIDLLDFIDEVTSELFHALDGQDVVRRRVAVEDIFTLFNGIAFLKVERLALGDQILDRLATVLMRLDDDATLVLVVATEPDRAIDLGDDGVILGATRLTNNSATRGRPPVMSLVLALSSGIRASTSPGETFWPGSTLEPHRPTAGSALRHRDRP